jgi:hypothetical protein
MKKQFYLLLAAIGISGTVIGQQAVPVHVPAMKNNYEAASKVAKWNQKDFDNPLFESDFSEALGDVWIVDNENASPAEDDNWVIGTDVPNGPFAIAGINSTTADNGFGMFDSDGYCASYAFPYPAQNAWIQTSAAIPLPAEDVSVQFETYYRAFQGQCFFEFSEDGNVWTSIELFADIDVNDATDNSELFTFFVEELSGVDEAFFRFRYVGACDYAWMIDDFKIAATPEFDIRMTSAWYDEYILLGGDEDDIVDYYDNLEYSEYLQDHVRPLTFIAEVENLGTSALTGVTLEVVVNTPVGDQTFTSDAITVQPFEFGVLEIPNAMLDAFEDGGELGDYTVNFSVFVAEDEGDLSNNSVPPKSFVVNDVYMANDRDLLVGPSTSIADDCTWGSQFVYKEGATVDYLAFGLIETATFESAEGVVTIINTIPGEVIYLNIRQGSVLEEEGPDNVMELLFEDDEIEYVIEEGDITTGGTLNWIIIPLPEPITLDPDVIYQAEVTLPIVGEDYCLVAQVSQQEELAGTVFTPDDLSTGPQGWFTLGTEAPALRIGKFGPNSTQEAPSLSFSMGQNFPNPVNSGSTRIGWELQVPAENITFTISDNTGKTIYQKDLGDRPAGVQEDIVLDDLKLAAGVYQYGLKVGNERMVRKMVITK